MRQFDFIVPLTRHHHPRPGACVAQDGILAKCNDGWAVSSSHNGLILQITDQKTLQQWVATLKPLYEGIYFVESNSKYRLSAAEKAEVEAEFIRLSSEFDLLKRNNLIVQFCCGELFTDAVIPSNFGFEDYDQLGRYLWQIEDNKITTTDGELIYLVAEYEDQTISAAFRSKYEELRLFADFFKENE